MNFIEKHLCLNKTQAKYNVSHKKKHLLNENSDRKKGNKKEIKKVKLLFKNKSLIIIYHKFTKELTNDNWSSYS